MVTYKTKYIGELKMDTIAERKEIYISLQEYIKAKTESVQKDFSAIALKILLKGHSASAHSARREILITEICFKDSIRRTADSFRRVYYQILFDAEEEGKLDTIRLEYDFPQKVIFEKNLAEDLEIWSICLERSFADYNIPRPPVYFLKKKARKYKVYP